MNNRLMALWPVVALVALSLAIPGALRADEEVKGDSPATDPLGAAYYVIKVTPTLAYLDIGSVSGAMPGQTYSILRQQRGLYIPVAKVRVLRVFDNFCIAETYLVEAEEEVAMLQRAVAAETWDALASELGGRRTEQEADNQPMQMGKRSIMILGGLDASKDVDLLYVNGRLSGADAVGGGSLGLRMSKAVSRHWRLALTYRISGEPLGGDADVTQLSIELDAHLMLRGFGHAGPYLGLGVGMHQLAWDSQNNLDDTAYKAGFNAFGGLDLPLANGARSLVLEGGYQGVMSWNDVIDASNLRVFAGLAVNF